MSPRGFVRLFGCRQQCKCGGWPIQRAFGLGLSSTDGRSEPDCARRALPYLEQMHGYLRAARQLYPDKPARAALAFADGQVCWLE